VGVKVLFEPKFCFKKNMCTFQNCTLLPSDWTDCCCVDSSGATGGDGTDLEPIDALAITGSTLNLLAFLPQIARIITTQDAQALSLWMFIIRLFASIMWVVYVTLQYDDMILLIPWSLTVVMNILIIYLIFLYGTVHPWDIVSERLADTQRSAGEMVDKIPWFKTSRTEQQRRLPLPPPPSPSPSRSAQFAATNTNDTNTNTITKHQAQTTLMTMTSSLSNHNAYSARQR
jgi:uncharacterized protein with PQ loop repeat